MVIKEHIRGIDYLLLSIFAYLGIILEYVSIFVADTLFVTADMGEWTTFVFVFCWSLTCILWGTVAFLLLKYAKKRYGFNVRDNNGKIKRWQWVTVIAIIFLELFMSYIAWNGFKVYKEFLHNGTLKFVFQYVYYVVETALFILIVVFGQKAGEKWFKNDKIPYGGIVCALTWGLGHIISRGSIFNGIYSAIGGLLFGTVYLLLNKDMRKTFIIIFIIFVI